MSHAKMWGKLVSCAGRKYKGLTGFKPRCVISQNFQPLGSIARFGSQRLGRLFQSEECGEGILIREKTKFSIPRSSDPWQKQVISMNLGKKSLAPKWLHLWSLSSVRFRDLWSQTAAYAVLPLCFPTSPNLSVFMAQSQKALDWALSDHCK